MDTDRQKPCGSLFPRPRLGALSRAPRIAIGMALPKDRAMSVPTVLSLVPGLFPVQTRQTKHVPSVLRSTSVAGNEDGENTQECLDLPRTRRTVRTSLIIKTLRGSQSIRPTGNVGTTVR